MANLLMAFSLRLRASAGNLFVTPMHPASPFPDIYRFPRFIHEFLLFFFSISLQHRMHSLYSIPAAK
jgi:hypothetical protein